MEIITNATEAIPYVKKLHDRMQKHNFMLCYRGSFNHSITKSILAMAEKKMEMEKIGTGIKRKVFNVMVECMQNICKREVDALTKNVAIFMIGKLKDEYVIYSGNAISRDKAVHLNEKLTAINSST